MGEFVGLVRRFQPFECTILAGEARRSPGVLVVGTGRLENRADVLGAVGAGADDADDLTLAFRRLHRDGPAAATTLRGAFAFAAWDDALAELWLVRDALGRAPLYACRTPHGFAFASSLRALEAFGETAFSPSATAVASFLGAAIVPSGGTLLEGVRTVEPGTVMRIGAGGERVDRYDPAMRGGVPHDAQPRRRHLAGTLDVAFERAMEGIEPVAVAFSGGFDSTLILRAALARGGDVRAFTLTSDRANDAHAERSQRTLAALPPVRHRAIALRWPSAAEARTCLAERLDAPAPWPLVLHNDALHRAVSGEAAVMLAGHGADEIFAGEGQYAVAAGFGELAFPDEREPLDPRNPVLRAFGRTTLLAWRRAFDAARFCESAPPYLDRAAWEIAAALVASDLAPADAADDPLDRTQLADLTVLNAWEIFALPAENGSAHGLEVRSPYLDRDVVDAAFRAPPEFRFHGSRLKGGMRALARGVLPPELLCAQSIGFDSAFDYGGWLLAQREPIVAAILGGTLRELPCIAFGRLRSLLADPGWYARNPGLAWRLFALTCWLDARHSRRMSLTAPRAASS